MKETDAIKQEITKIEAAIFNRDKTIIELKQQVHELSTRLDVINKAIQGAKNG